MLPMYASSWSPWSLAWSGGIPVKLRSWSTVPAGTSTTPFRYERWDSAIANGPFSEVHWSSVT